jgi:hypothetical protein
MNKSRINKKIGINIQSITIAAFILIFLGQFDLPIVPFVIPPSWIDIWDVKSY